MPFSSRLAVSLLLVCSAGLGRTATSLAQSVDADPQLSWDDFPGQTSDRPHAPWIFRCTLDGNPRMVVLALAADCWVSYDAENARFDSAWRGGVRLDGSVYTGAHGPNPSVEGNRFLRGPESQFVLLGGTPKAVDARWLGYRIEEGRAVLMSEIDVDGSVLRIDERPEAILRDGRIALERRFDVSGSLGGGQLAVRVPDTWADGRSASVVVTGGTAVGGLVALTPGTSTVIVTDLPPAANPAATGGAR